MALTTFDSDQAIWKRFVAWLSDAPPLSGPREMLDRYRARNIAAGKSAAEADHEDSVVQALLHEREDAWPIMFDNIYSGSGAGFTHEPNALLADVVRRLAPGCALDIGMGQGRNAVFLAACGWQVTGFDIAERGLAIAQANAQRAGLSITTLQARETSFDYGIERWDLIVFMYEPFPISSSAYVERLQRSMRPGGHIVIESFSSPEGEPNRPGTAIDPHRLLATFAAAPRWRLVHFEDKFSRADWGPERQVVRMVAAKR